MASGCGGCKHGHDTRPGGGKASPGTVWCSQRNMQMGKSRLMPCFVAAGGRPVRHCADCKKAKLHAPAGEVLGLGNIWCEKRRVEVNRQRSMECFE
jgi:hypothetical protein